MMHKENTVFKKREQKNIVYDMFMLPLKKHAIWKPYVISFLGNEERLNPLSTQRKIMFCLFIFLQPSADIFFHLCAAKRKKSFMLIESL